MSIVSGALLAPTDNALGIVAAAASPKVTQEIGKHFKRNAELNKLDGGNRPEEGSKEHVALHTLNGILTGAAGDNNALLTGLAAGGAELVAPTLSKTLYGKESKDLTADEKATVSALSNVFGVAVGAASGVGNAVAGVQVAQGAVENNDLKDYFPSRKKQEANQALADRMAHNLSSNPHARFTKTEADYLYQINTDSNLTIILDVNYLGTLKVSGNKFEEMPDGRKRITVKPVSNEVWAVTGTLTLVQRLDGSYGIFNDTYDYDIKPGVKNIPRNLETYFGEPSCGKNSGCTGYSIQFKGNVNPKQIKGLP